MRHVCCRRRMRNMGRRRAAQLHDRQQSTRGRQLVAHALAVRIGRGRLGGALLDRHEGPVREFQRGLDVAAVRASGCG